MTNLNAGVRTRALARSLRIRAVYFSDIFNVLWNNGTGRL
jgi:hypothetical protein